MLQNRVDPSGQLHAVPQRGGWFGNKGCLHDVSGKIRRNHAGKRWITCVTDFRGRRRQPLMQPGGYTELFFHDEATAYAAGHRPCAQCRYAEWRAFSDLWTHHFGPAMADDIDACLHEARLNGRARRLLDVAADDVPPGAMILDDGAPVLRSDDGWMRWSFGGYTPLLDFPTDRKLALLTPLPFVELIRYGLPVQIAQNDCFVH